MSDRWRAVFREQRSSGLSVAAFCRRARVSPGSFYAWRRRLRGSAGPAGGPSMRGTSTKPSQNEDASFVELKLRADASPVWPESRPAGGIELHLPGRRCLMIRPGFDPQTLLDLLAVLDGEGLGFATGATQHSTTDRFTTREGRV